jgi:hypothetical protein
MGGRGNAMPAPTDFASLIGGMFGPPTQSGSDSAGSSMLPAPSGINWDPGALLPRLPSDPNMGWSPGFGTNPGMPLPTPAPSMLNYDPGSFSPAPQQDWGYNPAPTSPPRMGFNDPMPPTTLGGTARGRSNRGLGGRGY